MGCHSALAGREARPGTCTLAQSSARWPLTRRGRPPMPHPLASPLTQEKPPPALAQCPQGPRCGIRGLPAQQQGRVGIAPEARGEGGQQSGLRLVSCAASELQPWRCLMLRAPRASSWRRWQTGYPVPAVCLLPFRPSRWVVPKARARAPLRSGLGGSWVGCN